MANRTSYIRENTDLAQWRYIETKLNPADKASRGVNASTLLNCTEWIQGPKFLWKEEQDWPQNLMVSTFSLSTDDPEVRRVATVCNTVIQNVNNPTNQLLTHFSSWTKLRRAVVWFLKLKKIIQSLCAKRKRIQSLSKVQTCTRSKAKMLNDEMNVAKNSFKFQPITLDDLLMAEKAIVTFCQREVFENEISELKRTPLKKRQVSKGSHIYKLDPVLEDGVVRVGGRLSKSAMSEEIKHPIILPKNHHISTLILQNIHNRIGHGGRNHMLSQLRKKYWIMNANSAARKVVSKCVTCKRMKGYVGGQKMSDLPTERLQPDLPPFTNVGMDYFGPFQIKRGRSFVKRYGVIFTCMSSRAVHLEVAHSLDTDSLALMH